MAVLVPRIRTVGVRLSVEEYSALERFCVESGARSISDLARAAICSFVNRTHQESALASTVNRNVSQVKDLQGKIERLSAEIALLRAAASAPASQTTEPDENARENGAEEGVPSELAGR